MKIRHVIYDSVGNPWVGGGGAGRVHQLYKRINKDNDILIICGNYPDADNEIDGVKYLRLGFTGYYALSRLSFNILAIPYIILHKADIWVEDIGMPLALKAVGRKKVHLASIQWIPDATYVSRRGFIGWIAWKLYAFNLKVYKNFMVNSLDSMNYIRKARPDAKIYLSRNGVNLPGKTSTPGDYLLFMGRIDVYIKGFDLLVEALKKIKNENDIVIPTVIAGRGEHEEQNKLRKLISEAGLENQITLIGFVEGAKKQAVFNKAKLFILPSRNEVSPLAIMESFASARAVLATDVGGVKELIDESKAGWLIDDATVDNVASVLAEAWTKSDVIKKKGELGRKYAAGFSWDKIANEYLDLLKRLAEES
jgi:glycogen(starch) synthase